MILCIDAEGRPSLLETDNLRKFHVHIDSHRPLDVAEILHDRTLCRLSSPEVAWVSVDGLAKLEPIASRGDLRLGIHAMVEKAKPHGWVSADGREIRAHIVWSDSA